MGAMRRRTRSCSDSTPDLRGARLRHRAPSQTFLVAGGLPAELLRAGRVLAVAALALAQVARQLGGDRVARRQILELVAERLGPALQLLDVRLRLGVGGHGL